MKSKSEEIFVLELEKDYKKKMFKKHPDTLTYIDILELISRIRYLKGQLNN